MPNSMPEHPTIQQAVIKVLQNTLMTNFNDESKEHEFNRLNRAIVTIIDLVPAEDFNDLGRYLQ